MAQPIPKALTHLVALNVEFNVLVCLQCKYTLQPTAISQHLADKYKTPIELRKKVEEYIKEFPFTYNHTTVTLPSDGSALQPIIPSIYSLKCQDCKYITQSWVALKQHSNKAHNKQRVADEDLYEIVQLQSWFDD